MLQATHGGCTHFRSIKPVVAENRLPTYPEEKMHSWQDCTVTAQPGNQTEPCMFGVMSFYYFICEFKLIFISVFYLLL